MTPFRYGRFSVEFPPERELLRITDDGTFTMWRSWGAGIIGRFAGNLPDPDAMQALVDAAQRGPVPSAPELEPEGTIEEVRIGDLKVEMDADALPDSAWAELARRCRSLLMELLDRPLAAVAGQLGPGPVLHLEHRGADALEIELGNLRVEVTRWADGRQQGSAALRPGGLGRVDAGPGWTLDVPFEPSVLGPGQIVATATFVARDGGINVPVVVTARGEGFE